MKRPIQLFESSLLLFVPFACFSSSFSSFPPSMVVVPDARFLCLLNCSSHFKRKTNYVKLFSCICVSCYLLHRCCRAVGGKKEDGSPLWSKGAWIAGSTWSLHLCITCRDCGCLLINPAAQYWHVYYYTHPSDLGYCFLKKKKMLDRKSSFFSLSLSLPCGIWKMGRWKYQAHYRLACL